jgi:DNA-binding GntR family transcriptional regulator
MPVLSSKASDRDQPSISDLLARAIAAEPPSTPTHVLLREEVYGRMQRWIVNGLLPPGIRLRGKEIAETMGLSRTPVREAIRRLEDEGLVVAEASRWTKVSPVDTEVADRLYPIIWALESLAIPMTGPWPADAIASLRETNNRLAAAIAANDAAVASDADTEFHRTIVEAAGNPEILTILDQLKVRMRRVEIAYFDGTTTAERSVVEHERVLKALESGALPTAAAAMESNWRASLDRLRERLGPS